MLIRAGFVELGVTPVDLQDKSILLEPNLVKPRHDIDQFLGSVQQWAGNESGISREVISRDTHNFPNNGTPKLSNLKYNKSGHPQLSNFTVKP